MKIGATRLGLTLSFFALLRQPALVQAPGNRWDPDHDGAYVERSRQGSYAGLLRVVSVAIEF